MIRCFAAKIAINSTVSLLILYSPSPVHSSLLPLACVTLMQSLRLSLRVQRKLELLQDQSFAGVLTANKTDKGEHFTETIKWTARCYKRRIGSIGSTSNTLA